VNITGTWQPSPSGKEQSYELQAQSVKVLGDNDSAVRLLHLFLYSFLSLAHSHISVGLSHPEEISYA
jgi:hypothetical protein